MIIHVEYQSNGCFRLTIPDGSREFIKAEHIPNGTVGGLNAWGRKQSTEALDLLEHIYRFRRSTIRFQHH